MSDATATSHKKAKIFFPNLNGVRAIAALMVVIAHIELDKQTFHLKLIPYVNLMNFGKVGVSVFFALSGFLITYLLLEERKNFNKISFKDFYMRRILRIWPLYFLVIATGFFIYPRGASGQALLLSVFFLPNLAFTLKLLPGIFDPIWSIGTEEQFYIFHPHFFRFKKVLHIFYALLAFLILYLAFGQLMRHMPPDNTIADMIGEFTYYARFDNMAIGALVATLYYNTRNPEFKYRFQKLFNLMFSKFMQVVLLLAFIAFIYLYVTYLPPEGDLVLATLSALLIVNLCETQTSIYNLAGKRLGYIGEISYGIYLLHKFPVYFAVWGVKTYLPDLNSFVQSLIIYVTALTFTLILAALSYRYFEKYFLGLKKKFAKITQH